MTLIALTPQKAADRAGVSRGTIMNAINDKSLLAIRDNRNRWQISPEKLSEWMTGRTVIISDTDNENTVKADTAAAPTTDEKVMRIAVLEAEARAKDQRVLDLENDRDSWRDQAQRLAQQRPRRWWPF